MIEGSHKCSVTNCYGDWRLHEVTMKGTVSLKLSDIEHLLTEDRLKEIDLNDVAWKGKHLPDKFVGENCICCNGERYRNCNTSYPGIVLMGVNNPYDLPYRLIDGKHRAQKLKDYGTQKGSFYVLTMCDIKPYVIMNPTYENL